MWHTSFHSALPDPPSNRHPVTLLPPPTLLWASCTLLVQLSSYVRIKWHQIVHSIHLHVLWPPVRAVGLNQKTGTAVAFFFFFFLWLLQISDVSIHHSVLGKIPGSNKTNYGLFDSILNPKCSTGTQLPHQHSLMEMERRYRQILLSFSIGCEKVVLSHLYHKSSCCCTLQKKRKQEQLEMLFRSRVKEIFRDFNGVVTWKADGKVRTSYPVGESRTSQSTDFLNPPNIMHYTSKCQLNHREPREHKALGVYSTTKCLYTLFLKQDKKLDDRCP